MSCIKNQKREADHKTRAKSNTYDGAADEARKMEDDLRKKLEEMAKCPDTCTLQITSIHSKNGVNGIYNDKNEFVAYEISAIGHVTWDCTDKKKDPETPSGEDNGEGKEKDKEKDPKQAR